MKILLQFFSLLLFSVSVCAELPHTFVERTPADAAEVNENFSELENRLCRSYPYSVNSPMLNSVTYESKVASGDTISVGVDFDDIPIKTFRFVDPGSGYTYDATLPLSGEFSIKLLPDMDRIECENFTISGFPAYINGSVFYQGYADSGDIGDTTLIFRGFVTIIVGRIGIRFAPIYFRNGTTVNDGDQLSFDKPAYWQAFDDYIDYINIERVSP